MLPFPQPIRTVIADDSPLAVNAIRSCLQQEPSIEIVGTAADGTEAIAVIQRLQPDLVLLDLKMPNMNGLQVASWLADQYPSIVRVIVTGLDVLDSLARLPELGGHPIVAKQDMSEQLPKVLSELLPRFHS